MDVAPLLAVATEIRERHTEEWVDRLVMKLLCDTRLACCGPWNDGQAVRELLRERGIATDASHYYEWYATVREILQDRGIATDASLYYEWYAMQMHLGYAILRWIDRFRRPPTYVDL